MALYAIGSAGLAALIKTIFDNVLQDRSDLGLVAWSIIGLNLLKGIGSYGSAYLMAWVGQKVVTDIRDQLFSHILGQSASFFADHSTGELMSRINNDVGQVQQAVSETAGDLARETLSLVGFAALLFYYDAWLAMVCMITRAADRVSAGTPRSARAPDDEEEPGGAGAHVARQRGRLHGPPHRQGVRCRAARERTVRAARVIDCTGRT
ncbi:MAG: ABC transporter transmembrane domain-containing protein [Vicinamibacterales bacterium]